MSNRGTKDQISKISFGTSKKFCFAVPFVSDQGHLYSWGHSRQGCLGLGADEDQYFPFQVSLFAWCFPIRFSALYHMERLWCTRVMSLGLNGTRHLHFLCINLFRSGQNTRMQSFSDCLLFGSPVPGEKVVHLQTLGRSHLCYHSILSIGKLFPVCPWCLRNFTFVHILSILASKYHKLLHQEVICTY